MNSIYLRNINNCLVRFQCFFIFYYVAIVFYSVSSQIVFIRLLMRQCKWLRRSTINYELDDVDNTTDYLTPLVQIGLLQDSKCLH